MNEWANLLNDTAQTLVLNRVNQLAAPSTPTAVDSNTGKTFKEGQPATITGKLAEVPKVYLIAGGVALAGLLAFALLRK